MGLTKYGPKEALSLSLGQPCGLCGKPFKEGDYTTLLRATRHSKHGDHNIEVHWECATKPAD